MLLASQGGIDDGLFDRRRMCPAQPCVVVGGSQPVNPPLNLASTAVDLTIKRQRDIDNKPSLVLKCDTEPWGAKKVQPESPPIH